MVPDDGQIAAPATVTPGAWASLPAARDPLVLAPSSERGWFGGRTLIAIDPVSRERVAGKSTLDEVGPMLEAAMHAETPSLTAVVLDYEGTSASVLRYEGGLVLTPDGWRVWGSLDPGSVQAPPVETPPAHETLITSMRRDVEMRGFTEAVERVRDAVEAGDVYVLNLTYRIKGTPLHSPGVTFAALLERGSSEMNAALVSPERSILSVSPERFLSIGEGRMSIQPIKGTRPRGADDLSDAIQVEDLARSAKESAEHVMIVDMERNDLGRVCEPGTVQAEPLKEIVTTPYCHQMVSTVSGTLRAGASMTDVLRAAFPCGSVTGAPKVAAMKHIEALERSPRGAYTGALIVAMPGALDSSVLIRTAEVDPRGLRYGTGGGITFESDPHEEWLETLTKAVPITGDSAPEVTLRETCRVVRGRIPLWTRHRARLGAGGCGPGLLSEIETVVAAALDSPRAQVGYARFTLTVTPDGLVRTSLDEEPSSLHVKGGPSFQVTFMVGAPSLPQGAAKPADRTHWDAAMEEARSEGYDQAVLADTDGAIIDGGTASVWVAFGERVFTPPAPPAIAGVARGLVLDHGHRMGLRPEVAHLRVEDLTKADEVIFTTAVAGPVAAFGQRGRATEMMKDLFTECWGEDYGAASPIS